MKKPKSKLDQLPEHQFMQLRDGLLGDWTYEAALSWLASECGQPSSLGALSKFFERNCAPILQQRQSIAAMKAEAIGKMAGRTNWNQATIETLSQVAFTAMTAPGADMKEVERILKLLLKRLDQEGKDADREIKKRELALQERKAKALDEAAELKRKLNAGGRMMPDQEREAILSKMDEVLGIPKPKPEEK